MKIEKWVCILLIMLLCIFGFGCSGSSTDEALDNTSGDSNSGSDDSNGSGLDSGSGSLPSDEIALYAVSVAETASTFNAADVVDNIAFDNDIIIDFSANTAQMASGDAHTITTEGVVLVSDGSISVTVAQTDYGVTITATGDTVVKYNLTGVLDGTLSIYSDSAYQLYLDGVTINGYAGPALNLASSQKAFIVAAPDTINTLNDSSTRSLTMKAALYGDGPMIFSGEGGLLVTGEYKHGIYSDDYIRIRGGEIDVAVTERDAIRSVNGFIFDDGDLVINATGDATDDESKGVKVEGDESADGAGKGYVVINGGYITITSVDKGITAGWDIDDDAETTSTSDDPSPYVQINNGVVTITTTGTPYEYLSGGSTVSSSPEGIEGKSTLTINNGYLTINTSDDALNAGDAIVINDGYIYCASSKNDAIDSNGTLTIAGGVLVAIGSSEPEGAFDSDWNTFAITGGTFVGIGGALSTPTASACTQNAVILGSQATGSTIAIQDAEGTVVFAYTIPQSYNLMLLSSPDIASGKQYTLYSGGTASADDIFNGLYLGNLSYSQGTAASTFTTSSVITNLGGNLGGVHP